MSHYALSVQNDAPADNLHTRRQVSPLFHLLLVSRAFAQDPKLRKRGSDSHGSYYMLSDSESSSCRLFHRRKLHLRRHDGFDACTRRSSPFLRCPFTRRPQLANASQIRHPNSTRNYRPEVSTRDVSQRSPPSCSVGPVRGDPTTNKPSGMPPHEPSPLGKHVPRVNAARGLKMASISHFHHAGRKR